MPSISKAEPVLAQTHQQETLEDTDAFSSDFSLSASISPAHFTSSRGSPESCAAQSPQTLPVRPQEPSRTTAPCEPDVFFPHSSVAASPARDPAPALAHR